MYVKGGSTLSKADSKVLRQNLVNAGETVPDYNYAAHHIVAGSSPKAAESRVIMRKYGVNINSATNGVFLPTVKNASESAYHPSLHTNAYYDEVNNMLRSVTSKLGLIDSLIYISSELKNGTFMK